MSQAARVLPILHTAVVFGGGLELPLPHPTAGKDTGAALSPHCSSERPQDRAVVSGGVPPAPISRPLTVEVAVHLILGKGVWAEVSGTPPSPSPCPERLPCDPPNCFFFPATRLLTQGGLEAPR